MRNILITGGCGFIGSNFVKILINDDTEYFPVILDSLTYAGNENNLKSFDDNSYDFVKGNICDIYSVSEILKPNINLLSIKFINRFGLSDIFLTVGNKSASGEGI